MLNKIIEEKAGVKLDIQYLIGVITTRRWTLSSHLVKSYYYFANNYVINAQKGALYADLTDLYKKEGKELHEASRPSLHQREYCKRQDLCCSKGAPNVASSQNFAFNGPLLENMVSMIKRHRHASLEPVLERRLKKKIQTLFHSQWTRATVDLLMTSITLQ